MAHLTGGVFLHADFFAPWCIAAHIPHEHCGPSLGPASHLIIYHYVIEGELHVRVEGADKEDLVLGGGEVVVLPRNDPHLMGSDLNLPPVPSRDIVQPPKGGGLYSIHHGGAGKRTRMICGFLGCDSAKGNPVISTLPSVLKLNVKQGNAAEWIRSTFQYAAEEVAAGRPGSKTVLAKLSELLFVEAVRRYAEALPDGQAGWLAGLREPHVARALALLHDDIARPWTVDDLGREVGLSRSALADRFIQLDWRTADALPSQLAHASRDSKAPQHQRVDCTSRGPCRLRLRSCVFSRFQKGSRSGAGHVAAFEQLATNQAR